MTRVKICGICRPEDARVAAAAGATAIGMVFWRESPRAVDVGTAREIVSALPTGVPAIGVFVNQSVDDINDTIDETGIFGVQLHGDEPMDVVARIKRPVIRAMTLEQEDAIAEIPAHVTVLLDAHDPVRRGGTGTAIDWERAARIARTRHIVLAGGLTPVNAGEAVQRVAPYAVDVSSGVERSPREKDHALIRAFLDAVTKADSEVRRVV